MSTPAAPTNTINFRQGVTMALDEAMAADSNVIVFGEDVGEEQGGGVFKLTNGLGRKYGDHRLFSTPIAEQAIVGAAIGAAIGGMRPVAEIMLMDFVCVAMDQIVSHAAKIRYMSGGQTGVPMTIMTVGGTGRGNGGQHSDFYEAWFAHVPGLKIVMPSNPADAKGLLLSCIEDEDPCIFVQHIMTVASNGPAPPPGYRVPLGKARVVRAGTDVTVIAYGRSVTDALEAAASLEKDGVSVEVIDLRTIAPFDEATVFESVKKTGRAVTLHEAVREFGVGAEISSRIHEELFKSLKSPVQRVGAKRTPVPFSRPLEVNYLYNAAELRATIEASLK